MVTDYQLMKAVTSLAYRRRLEQGIEDLESTIYKYLNEHQINSINIAGYQVHRDNPDNGTLEIEELPEVDVNQLELSLD